MPITTPWNYIETVKSGRSDDNKRQYEPDYAGESAGSFPKPAGLDVPNGGAEEQPEDEKKRKESVSESPSKAKSADAGALVDPGTGKTGFEDKGKSWSEEKKVVDEPGNDLVDEPETTDKTAAEAGSDSDGQGKPGAEGVPFEEQAEGVSRQVRGAVTLDEVQREHGSKLQKGESVKLSVE